MNSAFRLPHSAIVVLAGPTAAGKSEIAVELAEKIGAEILNCDAFQLYRGLDLLAAKPDEAALRRVPHHLVGTFPLSESMSVARYLAAAHAVAADVFARGRRLVVVGGTGLYVRALIHGLEPGPASDPKVREEVGSLPAEQALACLRNEDPAAFERVDRANPRRVQRALESARLRGRSNPGEPMPGLWPNDPAAPVGVFLVRERADLHARIARRTAEMFRRGVLKEVSSVDPAAIGATAAQMIGWRECLACLRGNLSEDDARRKIEACTRQYAKRQITWFKRECALELLSIPAEIPAAETSAEILRWLANVSPRTSPAPSGCSC